MYLTPFFQKIILNIYVNNIQNQTDIDNFMRDWYTSTLKSRDGRPQYMYHEGLRFEPLTWLRVLKVLGALVSILIGRNRALTSPIT